MIVSFDKVEKGVYGGKVGVGSKIASSIVVDGASAIDARKVFVGNFDDGVTFAVFKAYVIARAVFFYEGVFEK